MRKQALPCLSKWMTLRHLFCNLPLRATQSSVASHETGKGWTRASSPSTTCTLRWKMGRRYQEAKNDAVFKHTYTQRHNWKYVILNNLFKFASHLIPEKGKFLLITVWRCSPKTNQLKKKPSIVIPFIRSVHYIPWHKWSSINNHSFSLSLQWCWRDGTYDVSSKFHHPHNHAIKFRALGNQRRFLTITASHGHIIVICDLPVFCKQS